jgi:dTDP-4-dehydrorhamnose 3,5-epimerase
MKFTPMSIPDVLLIEPQVFQDERGFFLESYQAEKFTSAGIPYTFVQDNHSASRRDVLRGLHYQVRQPQGKLLRVVVGEIFDVAVDLRRASPTFGKWAGAVLAAQNKHIFWIPPGLAHGFLVLSDWAEVLYKATDFYAPQWERTLRWDDPTVGIPWPLAPGRTPILSAKDAAGEFLAEAEVFE